MQLAFAVEDWLKNFETKVKPFVEFQDKLDDEKAKKMGKKDAEAYPFTSSLCLHVLGSVNLSISSGLS